MSYDIEVWSTERPDVALALRDSGWHQRGKAYMYEARDWQIVICDADRVLPQEVPSAVSAELAGTTFLTQIALEPIDAPKTARALAVRCARALAKHAHGVVVDKQQDTITAPAGVKRFVPEPRRKRFAAIELSWWYTNGPLLQPAGLDEFVACLARWLPEALPRRYGLHEPPQHKLEESGLDHFRAFLAQHATDLIVWYPRRPVLGIHLTVEPAWGVKRQGFRCSKVSVTVESAVLAQSGWQTGLRTFWKEASTLIRPFYGDVRTLHGLIASGATYAVDMQTETGPVRGPFWRGVPRSVGHAFLCGEAYTRLWPDVVKVAEPRDDLAFVDSGDWREGSALKIIGSVPEDIAQRWTPGWVKEAHGGWVMNWVTEYPSRWPFGDRPPSDPLLG